MNVDPCTKMRLYLGNFCIAGRPMMLVNLVREGARIGDGAFHFPGAAYPGIYSGYR